MTISAGAAAFPDHGTTRDELVRAADTALYAAKQAGRNQVCLAALAQPPAANVLSVLVRNLRTECSLHESRCRADRHLHLTAKVFHLLAAVFSRLFWILPGLWPNCFLGHFLCLLLHLLLLIAKSLTHFLRGFAGFFAGPVPSAAEVFAISFRTSLNSV